MSVNVWESLLIGSAGGAIAGVTVWFIQLLKEKATEWRHKNRVYDWLYRRTEKFKRLTVGTRGDPRWVSTIEIASYTNLTPDRVRYICSVHEKIRPKMEKDLFPKESLEEKWGIRESVKQ